MAGKVTVVDGWTVKKNWKMIIPLPSQLLEARIQATGHFLEYRSAPGSVCYKLPADGLTPESENRGANRNFKGDYYEYKDHFYPDQLYVNY